MILPNAVIRDERLSYTARGVLAELLSRPDGWDTNADDMWRNARKNRGESAEGRRAFRSAFAELEECGYLLRTRERGQDGRMVTSLAVYDTPDHRDAGTGMSDRGAESGTSVPPAKTEVLPGHTDVPPTGMSVSGTSLRSTEEEVLEETPLPPELVTILTRAGARAEEMKTIIDHIHKHHPHKVATHRYLAGWDAAQLAELIRTVRAQTTKADVAARLAELKQGPKCTHWVSGGASPHPASGKPICPQCRAETEGAEAA
ncbi:hypothetical protein GCM10007079_33140 [Nocardiopsis terrae]|uniref:Helix-turn-helix domain-containing protein n=1 Tax=Nocardiopsis terrae TaxID=372655 RepID=A0ABR9HJC6_9ACTN|nr:hypothetical protein [Nocardiopsis terrae]MBE1459127.1 hypothetical protein [Nocardiopsis terrae]GHC88295.1 hypothetical protein GCM10007079_33140 [Nocardiopsis terrae]